MWVGTKSLLDAAAACHRDQSLCSSRLLLHPCRPVSKPDHGTDRLLQKLKMLVDAHQPF